ncbi:(d)CMP kinase [Ancylobacter amanitiformis]|uniref:Cytidylate kinase n=1 Tax=Ancylobacter amanitiformis TaxID=217069 RepID=A0ABU0LQY1_9HYPH|nr:(d)CMP kinase [Ancylobacter amanitiformis]MDQ0511118.1 cytidylate kinase [Ancylobacter amanitiformis]
MIIAIDGPAASGKGTIARALAAHLGLPHLDTGLLYRAVGAAALETGVAFEDTAALAALAAGLDPAGLDAEALKAGPVGEAASRVAAVPAVREKLLKLQKDFAGQPGGAVLDGRDIGTVIAPDAELKIFVTATPQARAERRYRELARRGEAVTFEQVLADIEMRDARDSGRASAPLMRAQDAVLFDNTGLDRDASIAAALALVADLAGRR